MPITNEDLKKRFPSLFELVNYSIVIAKDMIKSGRDTRVKTDILNRSFQILEEIRQGVDKLDDVTLSSLKTLVEEHDELAKQNSKEKSKSVSSSNEA